MSKSTFLSSGSVRRLRHGVTALLLSLLPTGTLAADPTWIEIVIPLEEGRFYSPRELGRQCNEKLGTDYPVERLPDRCELEPSQRLALLLLAELDAIRVHIEADRLVLEWPDVEDDQFRRQRRAWLRRCFGVNLDEWPEGLGLHVPGAFDPRARSVLLVHGLESGSIELEPLAGAFRESGVQVLTFDYPNDGPPSWSGERLSRELNDLVLCHASNDG